MSVSRDEFEELPHAAASEEAERLYDAVCNRLMSALTAHYGVAEREVLTLVDEAFYGYLDTSATQPDPAGFLEGLVCMSADERLGLHHATPAADDDPELARQRAVLAAACGLEVLGPIARRAVRLRVYERKSYEFIAEELDVSVEGAQGLVARGMATLMKVQRARRQEKP